VCLHGRGQCLVDLLDLPPQQLDFVEVLLQQQAVNRIQLSAQSFS
jgi:hypothetical protein